MIKRLLFVLTLLVAFSMVGNAQWTKSPFGKPAVDTLKTNSGAHGVTVDKDGKIWLAIYAPLVRDSVMVPDSNKYFTSRHIRIYNPDGSEVSWSPLKAWVKGTVVKPFANTNTGIHYRKSDNVIILANAGAVYGIDAATGAGKYFYSDAIGSVNKPATDDAGNIYLSHVLPGNPLVILNPDFTFNGNAVDTIVQYGRTLEVSPDGNTLYAGRYTVPGVLVFKRASEFDPYKLVDTLARGFKVESLGWNPANKLLYVACGSPTQLPWSDPVANPGGLWYKATVPSHYGIDVAKKTVVDSLKWVFNNADQTGANEERPRGIAFSNDGKYAYFAQFNASNAPAMERLVKSGSAVERANDRIATSYELSQNYPNPFNPTTTIKFAVAKEGQVTLKVYDMLGKEVATLVNQQMTAGNYMADFNASALTSGMYIYQLNANGVVLSHKMMLMK